MEEEIKNFQKSKEFNKLGSGIKQSLGGSKLGSKGFNDDYYEPKSIL